MKNIILLVSFLVGASAAAQDALSADKFKFGGAGRLRFENQEFTNASTGSASATGSQSFTSVRLRPSLTYVPNEQFEIVFEPQFAKRMGADVYVPSGGAANTLTETSGNTGYGGDSVNVFQGYMNVNFGWGLSFKAGRQVIKYADEIILGPANWGLYGRSFDALVGRWSQDGSFVDLIHAKVADPGVRSTGGDRDLNGVYASWNAGFWLKTVDAYWLQRMDHDSRATAANDSGTDNRHNIFGGRLAFAFGSFGLTTEYAQGTGNVVPREVDNDMYSATLSYKVNDSHKAALEYAHAGKNWMELYPTTNRALGRADVVGRRNLNAIGLHWVSEFSETFGMDFDAYKFTRASSDTRAYKTNGTTAFGSTTNTETDLGMEFDLALRYKQSANLTWSVAYAHFLAGSYLKETAEEVAQKKRDPQFYYVMLETKF